MTTHHTHRPFAASLALFALASLTAHPARPCSIYQPDLHYRQHAAPPGGVFVLVVDDDEKPLSEGALIDASGTAHPLVLIERAGHSLSLRAPELAVGTSLTLDGFGHSYSSEYDVTAPLRIEGTLVEGDPLDLDAPLVEVRVTEEDALNDVLLWVPTPDLACGGGAPLVTERVRIERIWLDLDTEVLGERDALMLDGWATEPGEALDVERQAFFEGLHLRRESTGAFSVDGDGRATTYVNVPPGSAVDLHLRLRDPATGATGPFTVVHAERGPDEDLGVHYEGCSSTGSSTTTPALALLALVLGLARRRTR